MAPERSHSQDFEQEWQQWRMDTGESDAFEPAETRPPESPESFVESDGQSPDRHAAASELEVDPRVSHEVSFETAGDELGPTEELALMVVRTPMPRESQN